MIRMINSPKKYVQGSGEINKLQEYATMLGAEESYAIVDSYILEHYREQILSSFKDTDRNLIIDQFNGECSKTEINRIIKECKSADVIIGIGGGKTLDTAKAVGYYTKLPIIIIPTAASSDAPCSALSVIYTEQGEFEEYLFLKSNPDIVLVDTDIIAKAPARLLIAGIGDALATYYEARACFLSHAKSMAGGECSLSALSLAKTCRDTLFSEGLKAKLTIEQGLNSMAVENIIEANTYLSGIGFESGGLAAAHAIHNGMTVLEESHGMLHGEKVAFGTLVQLVLENADMSEIDEVIHFCTELGLPTTLEQLGIKNPTIDDIMEVAKASCAEGETIFNMPFEVTPESVCSAICVANQLGGR